MSFFRWFNHYDRPNHSLSAILEYDEASKFIKSTAGIRVVEIRKLPDEVITYFGTFEGKVLKYSFSVPSEAFSTKSSLMLFVEDNWGNLLKKLL